MDIGKTGDKETTNADRRKKAGLPDDSKSGKFIANNWFRLVVISFMVGVIYYKEHISMTKVVGLCIVMFAVIYYSYNLDIQDEPKDTIKDKYVPSNVH